jgi:hypothetical protein
VIIRGEFVEDSFNLILNDPILYAFGIIVIISLLTLLYNMNRKRFIEIEEDKIVLGNKYKLKSFRLDEIESIKIFKKKLEKEYSFLRLVKIKLKNSRKRITIRTSDYENEEELISLFNQIKTKVEKNNV